MTILTVSLTTLLFRSVPARTSHRSEEGAMDIFAAEGFHYTGSSSWLSAAVRSSVATSTDLILALSGEFILKSSRDFSIAVVPFLGHSGDSAFRPLAAVRNRHGFHHSIDGATTGFLLCIARCRRQAFCLSSMCQSASAFVRHLLPAPSCLVRRLPQFQIASGEMVFTYSL